MGFRPAREVINLNWPEGHRLHGLEIKATAVPVDEYNDLIEFMFLPGGDGAENLARNSKLIDRFAENLRSWNYEDPETGEPLPADRAGIGRVNPGHLTEMIAGWTNGMVSVPGPLPETSNGGNEPSDSQERILKLASTSRSQAS